MKLNFKKSDVLKVNVHYGRTMPALFLHVSPAVCARTRNQLKMTDNKGYWLDIASKDETMKRITILLERLKEEDKTILNAIFGASIQSIDSKTTNELLVKSSPRDGAFKKMAQGVGLSASLTFGGGPTEKKDTPLVKYCQYPPTGANSVTVGTEDYICLEEEIFLNDVIIDFYFRWLQFHDLPEADRNRTHIFSTFFYKRLTTRPKKQKNKLHPVEDNANLSAADKRYDRVKRWTKKVDLFNKDFIFVPINEQ